MLKFGLPSRKVTFLCAHILYNQNEYDIDTNNTKTYTKSLWYQKFSVTLCQKLNFGILAKMNVNIKVGIVFFTLSYTLLAGQRLSFPCNNLSWHSIWIRICAPCLKTIAENKQIETLNLDGNLSTRNRHFIQKFWTEISENKQISMLRFLRIRAKIC